MQRFTLAALDVAGATLEAITRAHDHAHAGRLAEAEAVLEGALPSWRLVAPFCPDDSRARIDRLVAYARATIREAKSFTDPVKETRA